MQAILLAAGYGTRLRPYTNVRPKPLFPVAGVPLLHRQLMQLRACDCAPILVNCHHLADQIEAAVAYWPEVLIQHEPEILGTGGSLRQALNRMDNDPVLVMNSDLYHEINLEQVYFRHLGSANDVTLAMHDLPRFNTVGVEDGRVRSFADWTGQRLAFTGIHVIDPEVIERIPAGGFFHIIDLYRELAQEGRIGSVRVDGALWRDIGTPGDYLELHGELLGARGWLVDPSARVGEGVILEDWGCIGAGAMIGEGARLCRTVVWDGAKVAAHSLHCDAICTGDAAIDAEADRAREQQP